MTKLEAVNEVVSLLGEPTEFSSLDRGGVRMNSIIERMIDRSELSMQRQGWYWNTEFWIELTPTSNNTIPVDPDVLSIDTWGGSQSKQVVRLNNLMWKLIPSTVGDPPSATDFTGGNPQFKIVRRRSFDDIPSAFAEWIVAEAAILVNRIHIRTNPTLYRLLFPELNTHRAERRADAVRMETEIADVNVLETHESILLKGQREDSIHNRFF